MEQRAGFNLPEWIFNHTVGADCLWTFVPYKVLRPSSVPHLLQDYVTVLKQTGSEEPIAKAAIRTGVTLTKAQLTNMRTLLKFPLPKPAPGESTTKKHYVIGCIRHYFPDLAEDSDEFLSMYASLMGQKKATTCAEEVIAAVKALDPISAEDFKELKEMAENQLHAQSEERKMKKNRKNAEQQPEDMPPPPPPKRSPAEDDLPDPSPGKKPRTAGLVSQRTRFTPGELHSLIPGKGTLPGVYLKRIPGGANGKLYQGFYPAEGSAQAARCSLVG